MNGKEHLKRRDETAALLLGLMCHRLTVDRDFVAPADTIHHTKGETWLQRTYDSTTNGVSFSTTLEVRVEHYVSMAYSCESARGK